MGVNKVRMRLGDLLGKKLFALRITTDNSEWGTYAGDLAIFERCNSFEEGKKFYVVCTGSGKTAALVRADTNPENGNIILTSQTPQGGTMVFTPTAVNQIKILGVLREIRREVR